MKKRSLKLNSVPTEIHEVERFVEEICDESNINNSYFGNILVAVTEAFENAMIHGNESNPQRQVIISFENVPKGLSFEVKNEGKGFDIALIPDAADVEGNPEKKGTGLFLIKSLADEVIYSDNGRCIQMLFYISSINQQIADERRNKLKAFKNVRKEEKAKKDEESQHF